MVEAGNDQGDAVENSGRRIVGVPTDIEGGRRGSRRQVVKGRETE